MDRKTRVSDGRAHKLSKGIWLYRGYRLYNYGYYLPDKCVWWEASDAETGNVCAHAHTKRELMAKIDKKLEKGNKV